MIYIIIVLYNEKISSKFFRSIDEGRNIIIFLDNSTDMKILNFNANFDIKDNIYIAFKKNIGLSKAYNIGIEYILDERKTTDDTWIVILDDDTYIDKQYIENLNYAISTTNLNIISGIVRDQNDDILSPIILKTKKHYIKKIGIYNNIVCINSGIAIRSSLFDKIKFDEDLFLDMIDYKFFHDLERLGENKVLIIDGVIKQSFSGKDYRNYKSTLTRYSIYKKDFSLYCEKVGISIIWKYYILFKRKLSIIINFCIFNKGRKL